MSDAIKPALTAEPPGLSADERFDVFFGLALVAQHHREQIKDWRIRPRGDRRNKYVREWQDNQARIVAYHEQRIRELSALCGRLGGRDWIAAEGRVA